MDFQVRRWRLLWTDLEVHPTFTHTNGRLVFASIAAFIVWNRSTDSLTLLSV